MQEYINVNGEKTICKSKAKKTGLGYIAEIDFQIEFDKKNYNFNCIYEYELDKPKKLIIKSLDKDIETIDLIFDEIVSEWKGNKETFFQAIHNNFSITELKAKSLLEDVISSFEIENARINKSKELNKLNTLDIFVEI